MNILKLIKKIYRKCILKNIAESVGIPEWSEGTIPEWPEEKKKCPECSGKGNIRIGNEEPDSIICPDCSGTGRKMRKLK